MIEWFNGVIVTACLSGFSWHQEQLAQCESALIAYDIRLEEYQQRLANHEEQHHARTEDYIAKARKDFEASLISPRNKEKSEMALARSEIAKFEADRYEHVHEEVEHLIKETNQIRMNIREVLSHRLYFRVENANPEESNLEPIENLFDFEEITVEDLHDFGKQQSS